MNFSKNTFTQYYSYWVLIGVAIVTNFSGLSITPLESHEAFVVQTTQEMHDRGDLLVPYFNDEPRLTKPPLNYWVTYFITYLTQKDFQVKPWHARVPSALSGVLLIGVALYLGQLIYGRSIGLIAGWILMVSYGFAKYTHNARPEMLYALFCSLFILAVFMQIDRYRKCQPFSYPLMLMSWGAFNLAILTKGPHIPLLLLAGFILYLFRNKIKIQRLLRIDIGLLLFTLICLPWWVLVNQALMDQTGQSLRGTQLTGALYTQHLLSGFSLKYLWLAPQLLLPWTLIVPFILLKSKIDWNLRVSPLVYIVLISVLAMSFSEKKHSYYLLSLIVPMSVVLANELNNLVKKQYFYSIATALTVGILLCNLSGKGTSDLRYEEVAIAQQVTLEKDDTLPVITIEFPMELARYYGKRHVYPLYTSDSLIAELNSIPMDKAYGIVSTEVLGHLDNHITYEILQKSTQGRYTLVMFNRLQPSTMSNRHFRAFEHGRVD